MQKQRQRQQYIVNFQYLLNFSINCLRLNENMRLLIYLNTVGVL